MGRLCLRGAEVLWAPHLPVTAAGNSWQRCRGCQCAKGAMPSCVPPCLGAGGGGHRTEIGVGLCQPHWDNILEPWAALASQPGGGTAGEGAGHWSWQWFSLRREPLPGLSATESVCLQGHGDKAASFLPGKGSITPLSLLPGLSCG